MRKFVDFCVLERDELTIEPDVMLHGEPGFRNATSTNVDAVVSPKKNYARRIRFALLSKVSD